MPKGRDVNLKPQTVNFDTNGVVIPTNAIESLNMTLREVMKNKGVFLSDITAFKQIFLALQNISKRWTMPIRDWKPSLFRLMIQFDGKN